jgi:hypothetical protein
MSWWHGTHFRKRERPPKVPFKIIKLQRSIIPPDSWLLLDETGETYERLVPDQWLRDAVGARPHCYFLGRKLPDGWELKRYKGRALHW